MKVVYIQATLSIYIDDPLVLFVRVISTMKCYYFQLLTHQATRHHVVQYNKWDFDPCS